MDKSASNVFQGRLREPLVTDSSRVHALEYDFFVTAKSSEYVPRYTHLGSLQIDWDRRRHSLKPPHFCMLFVVVALTRQRGSRHEVVSTAHADSRGNRVYRRHLSSMSCLTRSRIPVVSGAIFSVHPGV